MRRDQWLEFVGGMGVLALVLTSASTVGAQTATDVEASENTLLVVDDASAQGEVTATVQVDVETEEAEEVTPPAPERGEPGKRVGRLLLRGKPDGNFSWVAVDEGQYWLGLHCTAADEVLRNQLNLKEGQGLVVVEVAPKSPAAKAGFKHPDVLVAVGDEPLKTPADLVKKVEAAKEGELTIKIIRAGKAETIVVKPEKRAEGSANIELPRKKLGVRMVRPGVVLPPGAKMFTKRLPAPALPDDMTVYVSKRGKEPAKISVEQGGKSWQTTDDKLDVLPDEVRAHIETLLGRGVLHQKMLHDVMTFVPEGVEINEEAIRKQVDDARVQFEKARATATEEAGKAAEQYRQKILESAEPAIARARVWVDHNRAEMEPRMRALEKRIDEQFARFSAQLEQLQKSIESLKGQHEDQEKE